MKTYFWSYDVYCTQWLYRNVYVNLIWNHLSRVNHNSLINNYQRVQCTLVFHGWLLSQSCGNNKKVSSDKTTVLLITFLEALKYGRCCYLVIWYLPIDSKQIFMFITLVTSTWSRYFVVLVPWKFMSHQRYLHLF